MLMRGGGVSCCLGTRTAVSVVLPCMWDRFGRLLRASSLLPTLMLH